MRGYKNLSYLIGQEVEIRTDEGKNRDADFVYKPDRVVVVDEYPDTLLIRKYFGRRNYLRMVTKAAMYVGDVQIRHGSCWLIGKAVR